MKKMIVLLAAAAVAGSVMADISVNFKNTTLFLKPGEVAPITSAKVMGTGTYAQLIWAPTAATYQDGQALDLSLLAPGEILLADTSSTTTAGRFATGGILFGNADVGGATINDGFFFARLFSGAGQAGDYFVEIGLQAPTLKEFNEFDINSAYDNNLGGEYSNGTSIDIQGTQVIPEPATIGLMGIAGLGMFLARKKTRR